MPHIGLGIPTPAPDAAPDSALEFAQRAESLALHSVWGIDRVVLNNQDALIALAAVAGATKRVRLGTSVLLGTLRPPLLLAKMVASLDAVSGGRVILGLGVGSREDDFQSVDVPFARRGARLAEHIGIMRQAWSGDPVRHAGAAYHYEVGPVGPRPTQANLPIWLGGSADAALKRVGQLGSGYIGGASRGPAGFQENWHKVTKFAAEAGRNPAELTPAALVFACVDDDRNRAMEMASKYMLHYYGARRPDMSAEELVGSNHLVGPADDCVRKAELYFAAGVEVLIVASMTADLAYLDRLCEQVLPRLQAAGS